MCVFLGHNSSPHLNPYLHYLRGSRPQAHRCQSEWIALLMCTFIECAGELHVHAYNTCMYMCTWKICVLHTSKKEREIVKEETAREKEAACIMYMYM